MFFYYFLLFILSITLLYSLGNFLLSFFEIESKGKYYSMFFKLFIGLISVISIYSVLKTGGKTINTGFILIGILYYFVSKQKIDLIKFKDRFRIKKEEITPLLTILLFSSFIFIWKYYCLFNNGQEYPIVINADSIFHSNIAAFLNSSGVESLNTNYFYPPNGTNPYHYFESWTIACLAFLLHLNYWITEELIVYPVYALLIVTGIWALIEKFVPLTILNKVFSLSVLFFSSFYFESLTGLSDIFNLKETYTFNFNALDECWNLKLSVAYIFSIAGLLLLADQRRVLGMIALLGLPIATISVAPGILGATSLFLFGIFISHRKTSSKIAFITVFIPFLVFSYILFFYGITGSTSAYITTPTGAEFFKEFNSFLAVKKKIVMYFYRILQVIIFYSPVWIILLLSILTSKGKWKDHVNKLKSPLFFTVILVLFSLLIWLLLYFGCGSKAYFFYASLPFLNILSVLLLIVSLETTQSIILKWFIRFFIFLTMVLFSVRSYNSYQENKKTHWEKYSSKFIQDVFSISKNLKNQIGGRFEGTRYFDNPLFIDNVDHICSFLSGFNKTNEGTYITTSLSSIDISGKQLKNTLNKNYVLTSPLYLFRKKQIASKKYMNNNSTRLKFIQNNKFEYLIVNHNIFIDDQIKSIIKKQLVDSKSGVSFILLDQDKLLKLQIIH